jgi:hypothetical protein
MQSSSQDKLLSSLGVSSALWRAWRWLAFFNLLLLAQMDIKKTIVLELFVISRSPSASGVGTPSRSAMFCESKFASVNI